MKKDISNNLERNAQEVAEFEKTGKTKTEILTVQLTGLDALRFRLLVGICDPGHEKDCILRIIQEGMKNIGGALREQLWQDIIKFGE